MITYNFTQEYIEYFDFIGNGYGCETRKITLTLAEERICDFFYNEDFCLLVTEQIDIKIIKHHKFLKSSKIKIINQKTDEILGNIKLPQWKKDDYKNIGTIQYKGNEYLSRRLDQIKVKSPETKFLRTYVIELKGIETKITYKLIQRFKPFSSTKANTLPCQGVIELEEGNLITLILGIYLVQVLLDNESEITI